MKIKNVSCDQFAGIRNQDVSFEDGINIIYGKNESGKSTLVNLISRTLFHNAKGRSDKTFFEEYLPCSRKNSNIELKDIDGRVSFETEKGLYTLSKEWGSEPSCKLDAPEGLIKGQDAINDILKIVLIYGEGLYNDVIFSPQSNMAEILDRILNANDESPSKKTITEVVSQAFAEGDGVSMDAIEKAISEKIKELEDNWDDEKDIPKKKTGGGRHKNKLGRILEAYYALEDAQNRLEEINRLEANADRANSDFSNKDMEVQSAKETYEKFDSFANLLVIQSEKKKSFERNSADLEKIENVLNDWPALTESLEKARNLRTEKQNCELVDKYNIARAFIDEIQKHEESLAKILCPSEDEIKHAKVARKELDLLERKLCGMNLNAAIRMLGNNTVEVVSLLTGDTVEIENGIASITEAVKITIPGVMEMQLTPADVDTMSVENSISKFKKSIEDIFDKYDVMSVDDLEEIRKKYADISSKIDEAKRRLEAHLDDISFEGLEAEVKGIPERIRSRIEIDQDIAMLCDGSDVNTFIIRAEASISSYARDYGNINELKGKAFDLQRELMKAEESFDIADEIPAEYLNISDPDAHRAVLKKKFEHTQSLREEALKEKTKASNELEKYKESFSNDPMETVEKAKGVFDDQKALLVHWKHIKKVFDAERENFRNNPMEGLAQSFTNYLSLITGGRVSSEFPDGEKLDMNIYSGNNLLDYKKLSEGTKETVSLAFRLAVLDHLFPDGGGVIVFDDPFANMDAERTAQSCELIKECAKQHQVLFLTCKEEYTEMFDGNVIRI